MTEQSKAQRLADELESTWCHESCVTELGAANELRRLDRHEQAHAEWLKKTEWVQKTAKPKELGMHRADVLKKRIDDLTALNAELVKALTRVVIAYDKNWVGQPVSDAFNNARAALAKAKEQT